MDNYLGEIRIFAGTYAPVGWVVCNGALLSISNYEALFTLIGTIYGGDGITTFGVPDLRQRIGCGQGTLLGGSNYTVGESTGVPNVTLLTTQIPSHTHNLMASTDDATTGEPTNAFLANTNGNTSTPPPPTPYPDVKLYTALPLPSGPTAPNVILDAATMSGTGGTQPHDNMMPYVTINYIIATEGIFPSFP
ncbi:tail fiber protein [Chitinophaga sp.]|uniref:phage tail protein n=1 Tax=Chitinophaga sp. TaxID=1869181 RepID=UPI0031D3DECE